MAMNFRLLRIALIISLSFPSHALPADNSMISNISKQQLDYYKDKDKGAADRIKNLSEEVNPKSDSAIVAEQNGLRSELAQAEKDIYDTSSYSIWQTSFEKQFNDVLDKMKNLKAANCDNINEFDKARLEFVTAIYGFQTFLQAYNFRWEFLNLNSIQMPVATTEMCEKIKDQLTSVSYANGFKDGMESIDKLVTENLKSEGDYNKTLNLLIDALNKKISDLDKAPKCFGTTTDN